QQRLPDGIEKAACVALEGEQEQSLLVFIGVVKAAALNPRGLRHIDHRCRGKSILPEGLEGDLQQRVLVELPRADHAGPDTSFLTGMSSLTIMSKKGEDQ